MRGLVQVYIGDGKGKTTAAMGLALRALGRGLDVRIVQFLKGVPSGETLALARLGVDVSFIPSDRPPWETPADELIASCGRQRDRVLAILASMDEGLVVLDEALGALAKEYLTRQDVEAILAARPDGVELIFTGRSAPQWLIERAGLVTEMKKIRHPFDRRLPAREGIEF